MKCQFTLFIFFLYCSIVEIAGCKKFVEIDPPNNKLVTTSVFNNVAATTAAITAIYTQMNVESSSMSHNCGLLSDELTNHSGDAPLVRYYTNSMTAIVTPATLWNSAYNYIYEANAILEGLQNNNDIITVIKNQLSGEAKFIRAYWYFYLTNCYGNVPLVVSTDYTINSHLRRSDRNIIYHQIVADLEDAGNLLNSNFVDQSDTVITTDRVRPTRWAAAALLARACLYTGDYAKAEKMATSVISDSTMFSLKQDLNKVFLVNSSEAIWQLAIPLPTLQNTNDAFDFILLAAPSNSGTTNTSTVSPQLLNAFEPGDQRKNNWIGSFTTSDFPAVTYFFPYKYKVLQSSPVKEYTMMLRLAEQYLIRAEAKIQLGEDPLSALEDMNIIRRRAGLSDYSGPTDKQSLLNAILHERQVELFTEWGHRWFDLARTGNANSVMGAPGNVCHDKGGSWSSNWMLFPIPQTERYNAPQISQNNGY